MLSRYLLFATILAFALLVASHGFVVPAPLQRRLASPCFAKKRTSSGQGFGQAAPETKQSTISDESEPLKSIETGGSDAIPTMAAATSNKKIATDSSLPPEERAKQVLREQYGLKTLEEQQTDQKKREQMAAARQQREQWQKAAEEETFDIIALIPGPVQIFIDAFLKVGVAICTLLFVSAGIGITAEAWSKASGNALPEDIDAFIVNVVEPNFTPGLLVLLGFSVSLGVFSALQLSSAGAQYREDK